MHHIFNLRKLHSKDLTQKSDRLKCMAPNKNYLSAKPEGDYYSTFKHLKFKFLPI